MSDEKIIGAANAALAETPVAAQQPGGQSAEEASAAVCSQVEESLPLVRRRYITLLALVTFGGIMSTVVPSAYSLALRVVALAPTHEEALGYIVGIGSLFVVLTSPIIGALSDRTRSRIGRRRPYMIGGLLVGLVGLVVIAGAPNLWIVGAGWIVAAIGLGCVSNGAYFIMADKVPSAQRGRVSAILGIASQLAPALGILALGSVSANTLLVFLIPSLVSFAFLVIFLIFTKDDYNPALAVSERFSARALFGSFIFNPRKYPDFGWNWLGRFVFFCGLYVNTAFGVFFQAQRLGIPVASVAGFTAVLGAAGIPAAVGGGIAAGFLSDKFNQRRIFVLIGALLFVAGAIIEAFAWSVVPLVIGSLIMTLSIAAFSAVDQAIAIEVLPSRAEAGRYISVLNFAQKIPSAVAPILAGVLVTIGATSAGKNYTIAYLIGGALALLGGLIIRFRVRSVR